MGEYSYWKKPWQKWCVMAAAALQAVNLMIHIGEYRDMQQVAFRVFSPEEAEAIVDRAWFLCALNGMWLAALGASLLLSLLARDGKTVRKWELGLCLGLTAAWGLLGFLCPAGQRGGWLLILALLIGILVWGLWKRGTEGEHEAG